jgi:hypothetical protein
MKARRGLSTVVGMAFAIIAISTTIAYVSYSTNLLNQYNNAVLVKNQQLTDTDKEKFQIASVAVVNNKLNVTLANTGSVPINFTKIWVQNKSATDWIRSYTPPTPKGFVSPGATLTNLGQNIGVSINPANSYNVKLVTSRGTNQAFTVNSAGAVPLNIQFMFLPRTVSGGFNTTLVMILTNNSTGMLTNISPSTLPNPITTGAAKCTASSVTPSMYNTLAPGNTAIFTWSIKASGNGGDICSYKYSATPPLQNGYMQTIQANATITTVSLASTSYSQNSGVITLNYTSFRWTTGGSWNNDWGLTHNNVAFQVTITNNNQTNANIDSLWLSKNSMFCLYLAPPSNNNVATNFWIVGSVDTSKYSGVGGMTSYADYSTGILNGGNSKVLYFGALTKGSNDDQLLPAGNYMGFVILYGKFTHLSTDNSGSYAQTIPFMAIISN